MADESTGVAQQIVQGLADNVKKKVNANLYGWVLSAFGAGGGSDPVLSRLDQIQSTLTLIQKQIRDLHAAVLESRRVIILAVEWNTQTTALADPIARINTRFELLQQLKPGNEQVAADLRQDILNTNVGVADDLTKMDDFILDAEGGASPDQKGLLNMWIDANIEASLADFKRADVGLGKPLDLAAHRITRYFLFLAGMQLKGATLLINAYTAKGQQNLAEFSLNQYFERINRYAQVYRHGMEQLLVSYCYDQTLLGYFANGRKWTSTPVLLADLTISGLLAQDELVVRVWGGKATSGYTFDTGTLVTDANAQGPALLLRATGGSAVNQTATPPNGELTIFPQNKGAQWSLVRYRFVKPPAGNYVLDVSSAPSFFNCYVQPANLRKYERQNPEVVITGDGWPSANIGMMLTALGS